MINLLSGLWKGEARGQHTTDDLVLLGILVAVVLISVMIFRWE